MDVLNSSEIHRLSLQISHLEAEMPEQRELARPEDTLLWVVLQLDILGPEKALELNGRSGRVFMFIFCEARVACFCRAKASREKQ